MQNEEGKKIDLQVERMLDELGLHRSATKKLGLLDVSQSKDAS